ncbi:MAG: S41 family peptidase [Thermoplasmata archaeon]
MKHYLMYPDIHGEKVCFVTEDDLWLYDGSLKRITEGLGVVKFPKFSSDGKSIIFTVFRSMGKKNINPQGDLYIYSLENSEIRRITYFGSNNIRAVSSYDKKIYFISTHGTPLNYYPELYYISLDDSGMGKLPYGNASYIGFGNNFTLLGRNTGDPARWKRYRGGTVGQLWVSYNGEKFHRILENLNGNIGSPMIFKDRICFISDHEGIGRIYCYEDGRIIKITDNIEYYARNANSDGKRIIFQMAGDLYVYDGETKKLDIDVYGPKRTLSERFLPNVVDKIDYVSLNYNGDRGIFSIRGKLYEMDLFDGPVIITDEIRLMKSKYLEKDKCAAIMNRNGKEYVVLIENGNITKRYEIREGMVLDIFPSPDGKRIIFSTNRLKIHSIDLEKERIDTIDESETGPIHDLEFSPDGRWIAYSIGKSYSSKKIRIRNIETHEYAEIEGTYMYDISPSFDPKGRFLYFISIYPNRPEMDEALNSLAFPNNSKIFGVALKENIKDPFIDKPDEEEKEFNVDLKDISRRIFSVPIKPGKFSDLKATPDGFIFISENYNEREGKTYEIKHYSIEKKKEETLVEKVQFYNISGDRKKIIYIYDGTIRLINSMEKNDLQSNEPGRESGIINPNRIKIYSNPKEEFNQMLYETWFMMKENYWKDQDIDWDYIFNKYHKLMDKISTRSELSDLIWEMQGELGTSHSYEMLGDYFNSELEIRGYLGAEMDEEFRIKRIYRGRLEERSPLLSSGVDIRENDVILEINGIKVDRSNPPGKILINHPNDVIRLKIKRDDDEFYYNVKTIGDESLIIYRDWIERNRKYVHEKTNGLVGYIHIPDMSEFGFTEFHRGYFEEISRPALIIDVRFNRGGYVSWLLLDKLKRKIIGYDYPKYGIKEGYPYFSPKGPIVCITNELAGSDGDIFSHAFKVMKIGPLIGTRTWGGVIGIEPKRMLVDGSIVTQPEYAFYFMDVGFGIENHGTDPDYFVDITPDDYANNRDTQLDFAIKIVMEMMDKYENK